MSTYEHKNTDLYNDSYYIVEFLGIYFFFNMRLNSHEFDQSETTFNCQFQKILLVVLTCTQVNLYLISLPLPTHPKIQTPLFRMKVSYISLFIALAIFLTRASKSGRISHASVSCLKQCVPLPRSVLLLPNRSSCQPLPYLMVSKMTSAHT